MRKPNRRMTFVARAAATLLLICTLLSCIIACKPTDDPATEPQDTTNKEEETTNVDALTELSLSSIGGFFRDGNVLRMNRVHEDPILDLSTRFRAPNGSHWCLTADAAGEEELEEKSVTLQNGENRFFVKVKYRKEFAVYEAIVQYREAYTVSFYSNSNELIDSQILDKGAKATKPSDPTRDGYRFLGWFYNGEAYDFSKAPTESLTLIAHWEKLDNTYSKSDLTVQRFEGVNAGLHVVWKDYANANSTRPDEVICILTQTYGNNRNTYEIVLKKDTVAWKDPNNVPSGAVLTRGAGGDWTLSLTNLPEKLESRFCNYTLTQQPVGGYYSTLQSGTAAINTVCDYMPSADESAKLTTANARLYDAAGNLVVLKGVVTLNVSTETDLADTTTVAALQKLAKIGCNGIRLTAQLIGSKGKANGYVYYYNGSSRTGDYNDSNATRVSDEDKQKMLQIIDGVIANATEAGMYVVIDWGILASNPCQYVNEACEFFGKLAEKHADNPYVIFEICNEPVANWDGENSIKEYANALIDTIRKKGSDAIVIVAPKGSATNLSVYSGGATAGDDPIDKPLDDDRRFNVAYTFHCYPFNYSYDKDYSYKLRDAYEAGLTVISTEMSPMDATFDVRNELAYDMEQAAKYVRLYQEWDVSFFYFRYASPNGSYNEWMMLKPYIKVTIRDWTREDLTECGKWYYDFVTGNGIFTKVDFKANRVKDVLESFKTTHAAYGLENIFPGFAVSGTVSGSTTFFKVNDFDALSDAQYAAYCQLIWDRIYKIAGTTAKQPNGAAFTDVNVPSQKTEPMELAYSYGGSKWTLKISYGQASNGSWGITVDIHS